MNQNQSARANEIKEFLKSLNIKLAEWERTTSIEAIIGSHKKENGDRVYEQIAVGHLPFSVIKSMSIVVLKSQIDHLQNEYDSL